MTRARRKAERDQAVLEAIRNHQTHCGGPAPLSVIHSVTSIRLRELMHVLDRLEKSYRVMTVHAVETESRVPWANQTHWAIPSLLEQIALAADDSGKTL